MSNSVRKMSVYTILIFLAVLLRPSSTAPVQSEKTTTEKPLLVFHNISPLPIANVIERNTSIPTHVVGHLEDLEATTWVGSLEELSWTFPAPYDKQPFIVPGKQQDDKDA